MTLIAALEGVFFIVPTLETLDFCCMFGYTSLASRRGLAHLTNLPAVARWSPQRGMWPMFRQTLRAASVLQHMEEIRATPKSFGRSDPKPNERAWSRRGGAWISPRLQKPSESHWSYSRAVLRPPQQPEEPIRTESSA